jgi:hypothetical protein
MERLNDAVQPPSLLQRAGRQFVAHDDGRKHRHADAFARQQAHHRHVVHLGRDHRR